MKVNEFRRLALSLPEAIESEHMNHPDFRVDGRIFATLGVPDKKHGMVKLTPDQQQQHLQSHPDVFVAAVGAWGKRGCTYVRLELAARDSVWNALRLAWTNVAPKKLSDELD